MLSDDRIPSPARSQRFSGRDDAQLIRSCLSGESSAWEALIERYQALIYATLRRSGLAGADADDIFQDVCLVLYNHLTDLRDTSRLAGWLVSTSRREAWRLMRRRGATQTTQMSQIPESEWKLESAVPVGRQEERTLDAEAIALEEQHLVRQAMDQLADRCRSLLSLLYMRDPAASYQEISESLGMPIGGIGPNRARCLQHLKKILAKLGF